MTGKPGMQLLDDGGDLLLVAAVDVGVDERDRQRLDARGDQVLDRSPATCVAVDRDERVCPRASIRSTASRVSASDAGGSGLTMMIQPASGPGRLRAREVQDLAEALGRDQPDARALGLEHGVGRDGRPVDDVAEVARARCRPRRRCARRRSARPRDGSRGRRRRLHAPLPVIAVVDQEQVGERPSDVHAQPIRHARSSSRSRRRRARRVALRRVHSELLQHCVRVGAHRPAGGLADRSRASGSASARRPARSSCPCTSSS